MNKKLQLNDQVQKLEGKLETRNQRKEKLW